MSALTPTLTETLRLELTTPIDDERPVYISGNFCAWDPEPEPYRMQRIAAGRYVFNFPDDQELPDPIEYKYTRGGWDQAELQTNGYGVPNRTARKQKGWVHDYVPRWAVKPPEGEEVSMMPQVETLSELFTTPQFPRPRRVHVLLPYDYNHHPGRRYPVLYLTDGQNLFGEGSSFGNWGIDKQLAVLAEKGKADVIIVAIEHGEDERMRELSPYDNARLGKGEGAHFLRFIINVLKPKVDSLYRTLPDRLHTGLGGSSLGGLLSVYAALMYPHVFGKLMIFSPSLWLSERVFFDAIHFFEPYATRMYLYGGGEEGGQMVPKLKQLRETIKGQGFGYDRVEIKLSVDPKGEHSEERWGEEFPKALEWLFD
ncbi:alpha/beta hydrolase-fold protein [Rhabdobacter roseus]|uniref:Putative alpha/beta superfamily hydrolase n=1 Tax=Rhabdobacter roseus TaxID=1655419 RepID=A0A840TWM5_9BACT|nr:alpha/beta hydrolase-fold protein [Rhabdobacter roseus]MBB5285992.1 putative alpha/beta superfamily hydrolase [Rhabdobacter roseus]